MPAASGGKAYLPSQSRVAGLAKASGPGRSAAEPWDSGAFSRYLKARPAPAGRATAISKILDLPRCIVKMQRLDSAAKPPSRSEGAASAVSTFSQAAVRCKPGLRPRSGPIAVAGGAEALSARHPRSSIPQYRPDRASGPISFGSHRCLNPQDSARHTAPAAEEFAKEK